MRQQQHLTPIAPSPVRPTCSAESTLTHSLSLSLRQCTANFPAAWPKWIDSQYLYTDVGAVQGVLIAFLGPSTLRTTLRTASGTQRVVVEQRTSYPFTIDTEVTIIAFSDEAFPLQIRIPGWLKDAAIHTPDNLTHPVPAGTVYTHQHPGGEQSLTLTGRGQLSVERRYNNAATVSYGPLVFALEFPYNTTTLHRYPHNAYDLQLLPVNATVWQYALQLDEARPLNASLTLRQFPIPELPFDPSTPPLRLEAWGRQVQWPEEEAGVAAAPPVSPVQSKAPLHPISLIPYGSSMLRIAEIPTLATSDGGAGAARIPVASVD